jgi:hypothetical protein
VTSDARPVAAERSRARIAERDGRIVLRTRSGERRFKYVGSEVCTRRRGHGRSLESRPPVPDAEFEAAPQGGCLTLETVSVGRGRARASGTEDGLFEHTFQLVLRKRGGRTARAVAVTATGGDWSKSLRYSVGGAAGHPRVVDVSEQDGSLSCIAQGAGHPEAAGVRTRRGPFPILDGLSRWIDSAPCAPRLVPGLPGEIDPPALGPGSAARSVVVRPAQRSGPSPLSSSSSSSS